MTTLVKKAGYESESVVFLPVSGWTGDNIVRQAAHMPFFRMWSIDRKSGGASGRTLFDAIDSMELPPRVDRPLRVAVHGVYMIGGI
jgi:elongation factor 1-alpha